MTNHSHLSFRRRPESSAEAASLDTGFRRYDDSHANQVITFGCRLNTYESEVIKDNLVKSGVNNAIVFNTCSVTAEAERQARQAIRKARRENPDSKIIVTGCAAQINPEKYAGMDEVDLVLGNEEKLVASDQWLVASKSEIRSQKSEKNSSHIASRTSHFFANNEQRTTNNELATSHWSLATEKIIVNDIMSVKETALHMISSLEGRTRAFVQVQNGCNHRCTFCIIPYGRGNSRSVPFGEIFEQVQKLVETGYAEIVLTGVDISDYGKDLPGSPTLGSIVKRLLKLVPEMKRLRISSIDAVEVDDDLYDAIANEERLMPHMHVSLQAGDDMVLKRMKRRHLRKDILDFTGKVRELRPDMVFGADIIAGFPTETEEMFRNTLNIVEEAGLTFLHVFPYSERSGTPAAKMPQVAKQVRKERAERLRNEGAKAVRRFYESRVGKLEKILIEETGVGRTEHFAPVKLDYAPKSGEVITAKITAYNERELIAHAGC